MFKNDQKERRELSQYYYWLKAFFVGSVFFILAIIVALISGCLWLNYQFHKVYSTSYEEKNFIVREGEGIKKIADNLLQEHIICSDYYFEAYVWLKGGRQLHLQAGEYELSPSMNIIEIVEKISGGDIVSSDIWVTIPEGFSIKKIDARLAANGLVKKGEFASYISAEANIAYLKNKYNYDFLSGEEQSLEGYLFPDTYKFKKEVSLEDITIKILDNFDNKLNSTLRREIKSQNKSIREIIILASIVQNEVLSKDDMEKVASVFYNRLEIGQALQSDATVNYITEDNNPMPTLDDLQIDSPYNTYRYAGLPPGPISNPGLDAIKAAVYPAETNYFYFLNPQDGSGVTIFSKTLEEHNINKAKYLK